MKKMMTLFSAAAGVVLGVFSLTPFELEAQERTGPVVLTLDSAIETALSRNPFYLAAQEREFGARAAVQQAAAAFYPSLSFQGTDNLSEKNFILEFPSFIPGEPPQRIEMDFTRDYTASLGFSLPLFVGGLRLASYNQAKYGLQATREDIRRSSQDTVYNVKQAFYGHLLARRFADVSAEALALAEKHYRNVKSLYDVGMASKFDLLRSEVDVANLKPQVIKARNSLSVSELGLKTVLGLELATSIEVRGDLVFTPLEADVEASVKDALAERPELRQVDFQRLMSGEMLKAARAAYFPAVTLVGNYNVWGDTFRFRRDPWQNYYTINLVVSWSLFNGFESQAMAGQAKAAMRELDWTQKGLADTIEFEVRQAVLNYEQARESLLSQEKNVEQAREAVRIAELNYTEGLATTLDVSTAQMALSQARTNHAQALYDCVISQAQLEKAVGRGRPTGRPEERRKS